MTVAGAVLALEPNTDQTGRVRELVVGGVALVVGTALIVTDVVVE